MPAFAVINQPVALQAVNQTYATVGGPINANSSSVILKITSPDGNVETVANGALTNPATGLYWYTYVPAAVGLYLVRWESSSGAHEDFLEVTSGSSVI